MADDKKDKKKAGRALPKSSKNPFFIALIPAGIVWILGGGEAGALATLIVVVALMVFIAVAVPSTVRGKKTKLKHDFVRLPDGRIACNVCGGKGDCPRCKAFAAGKIR